MKRLVMGILVLSLLLGIGITVSCLFSRFHRPGGEDLQRAAQAADRGNWTEATAAFSRARARWEDYRYFTAAFADHAPMDEIDGLFARLEFYARQQDGAQFPALCAHLAVLLDAMADSHRLTWWTLL